ncbi:multidrug resistance protein 3 [Eremomyces bilateralis CBS 781.70]|uniref:Multidrug resistance protein 3 n=1 Tax=Eremomyces bilateralis CBS 781.70 TaxID=1392243 RepID=A0A6G1G2R5_9PEZI|nr:multidrug resistance protein 3 [Eremomyces bilateralis CBS 781.70]KAF1812099.1 multidrug resistance protein 3 [Eremomyces bilateralis CBS 781.70]
MTDNDEKCPSIASWDTSKKPQDDLKDQKEEGGALGNYFRIFKYTDRLGWILNGTSFFAAIAAGTMLPLMDLVFGKFVTVFNNFAIGAITPDEFRSSLGWWALWFVYLFIAKFALIYYYTVAISISAIRTTKALRIDFLRHVVRQDIAFFDTSGPGSIPTQITSNGNQVNQGISEKLGLTLQGTATFVAAFVVAFNVNAKLTGITMAVVPAILLVTSVCVGVDVKQDARFLSTLSKASVLAEDVFSSIRTVHSFWLQPKLSAKYDEILRDAEKLGRKKSLNYAILFSSEFFCIFSGYSLAFWQGIRMYGSGEITNPGDIVTVIFAVVVAATAMTTIAPQILVVTKASSAAEAMFKTIDRVPEIDALSEEGKRPARCAGDIRLRNLRFAYPARKNVPVLKGLNLDFPAGKTTAVVGPSGSGKSTLVGLLNRWYNPSEGNLYFDGVEITQLNIRWLRSQIRVVAQEPVLFTGSIFENVALGLEGTDMVDLPIEEKQRLVKEACKAAYADEFIEQLPWQYETQVGERAMMLSGGQKQRLAIARSIISNPRVLLLDEATSALDPKAEKIVQKALDNVSADRTTLVIAHRLSTVRNADNIAVLSDGAVTEQGTHDQLIEADGIYARLVRIQDLGNSEDDDADDDMEQPVTRMTLGRFGTMLQPGEGDGTSGKELELKLQYGLIKSLWIMLAERKELYPALLVTGIVCIIGGATYPAQAIVFSRVFNTFQLEGEEMIKQGNFNSLLFFIIALGNLAAYGILGWATNTIAQVCARHYRLEMFQSLMRQDIAYFDAPEHATGALVSKLASEPQNLMDLLGFNVGLILINFVNITASSILAFIVGWRLALAVVFGALPVLVFCGYLRIRLETHLADATGARFAEGTAFATEAISAIRTVASLTLEKHTVGMFEEKVAGVARHSARALMWTMFWYALSQSVTFLAMALGFWYGGRLMSFGEYTTTQFFIVFVSVIFSGEAGAAFFSYTTSITKGQAAANTILALRKKVSIVREADGSNEHEKYSDAPGGIEGEKIHFVYPRRPGTKVIKGISPIILPGQFAAFVGPSGCGKSTMIALLERLYDPVSGVIRFDDKDITALNPRHYRAQLSLVQQEPVLYQASVRENIAMGLSETDATEAQIIQASQQSNIYDFITSLPDGFDTLCGSKGGQLSGGQRQRIAIARALIRKPRLLLLDEATSALDTESEKVVQAALERAKAGRTTVAVAHRLSTIKDADVIFVFNKGKIVEQGNHRELMGRRGMYYEMCLGQSLDR